MSLQFQTKARHGYSVKFSPYFGHRLACATSQYFGVAGCGTLFVFDVTPQGLRLVRTFDWNDGLFDVCWAEDNENVILTSSGDGSFQVWDVTQDQGPLQVYKEHTKEVNSVDWSLSRAVRQVLTASWDSHIKLWDLNQPQSLQTFSGHSYIVYAALWSPLLPETFASASGDKMVQVWDTRQGRMPVVSIAAHDGEVLTLDWCKYDQNLLFSGSVDTTIRGWDIRNPRQSICQLQGHQYAVRRIKASPFVRTGLASCSYDFTVRFWDFEKPHPLETVEHHTEFVYGLDFNLHVLGQVADCGWDEMVRVYSPASCRQL